LRVEERQGSNVDGFGRVVGIHDDSRTNGAGLAAAADADIAKEILGVAQVCFLFCATKSFTALSLRLFVIAVIFLLSGAGTGSLMRSDAFCFGLLVGCSLGSGLCFGLCGLALLFALYLGILGSIPGLENLDERFFFSLARIAALTDRILPWLELKKTRHQLTSLSSSSSSNCRRRVVVMGGEAGGVPASLFSSSAVSGG